MQSRFHAPCDQEAFPEGLYFSLMDQTYPNTPAMKMQVEGESYALGWNAAANYAFDDKNEMGIVYRSAVNHSMEANVRDKMLWLSKQASAPFTDAYGCVTLPESVMIGYGHKFNDKTRVELNGTWTRWSRFDKFDMDFGHGHISHSERNWKDDIFFWWI